MTLEDGEAHGARHRLLRARDAVPQELALGAVPETCGHQEASGEGWGGWGAPWGRGGCPPSRLGPARKPLVGVFKGKDGVLEEGNEVLGWAIPSGMRCLGIVLLHLCPPMGCFPTPPLSGQFDFPLPSLSPPWSTGFGGHGQTTWVHMGARRELATIQFST